MTSRKTAMIDDRDRKRWISATLIGVAVTALAMMFSLRFAQLLYPADHGWYQSTDIWQLVDGGRFVAHGALGAVYQGTGSYALPLSFILMAPVSFLVDRYNLVEGIPYPIPHPSAWLIAGPYSLLFGIFLLHSVRSLAWDLGVRSRLWQLQLIAVVVVLIPCFEWGHFEDVMALTATLHATRKLLKGDWVKAGLWLAVAISFKQWAVMLLPLMVFLAPPGRRVRTLVACSALPASFVLFVLGSDWSDAFRALFSPTTQLHGYEGHSAAFLGWFGQKASVVGRATGTLVAASAGWRARGVENTPQLLAVVSGILIVRPLFEPLLYSYYLSPGLLLAGFVGTAAHRRIRLVDWVAPMAAVCWSAPRSNPRTDGLWWAGEGILLALTALRVLTSCGVHISVKKPGTAPILQSVSSAAQIGD